MRPNVLLVTHRTPYPPDKGDRIRSYHLLRFLSKRSQVHLATLADEPVTEPAQAALAELAERVAIVPVRPRGRWLQAAGSMLRGRSASEGLFRSSQLHERIRAWTAENTYDAVVVVCSAMAQYISPPEFRGTTKIVDLVDVDSQKWFDYASSRNGAPSTRGLTKLLYRLEGRRVRRLEASLPQRCDYISVVTEAEVDCFRTFQPNAPIAVVPNGVDLEYFHPSERDESVPHSCVFVGAMDYKPNVDAVQWYSDSVWPTVVQTRPESTFTIVGRRPTQAVHRLQARPGIRVEPDVADVRPYLWKSSLVVAPLQIARGVQNKVLEAMAAGRAVIVSPQALTGIEAVPGEHVVLAETGPDWCVAIGRLFDDSALRLRLGQSARRYAEQHHSWDKCLKPFAAMLDRCHANP